jgi:hypothetical protein
MTTCSRKVFSRNDNVDPIPYGDYNVSNYVPLNDGLKAYKSYQAEVVCELRYSCDLCGENAIYGELHGKKDFVYLCSECFKQLEVLSNGKVKESIENFLIGNVI